MRTNEKSRYAGTSAPNMDGLNFRNLLEMESGEGAPQFFHEAGLDNSSIQYLKKELERG